jgi:hypothetical protein
MQEMIVGAGKDLAEMGKELANEGSVMPAAIATVGSVIVMGLAGINATLEEIRDAIRAQT